MPIGIVINPTSGKGNGEVVGEIVLQELARQKIEFLNLSADSMAEAKIKASKAVADRSIDGLFVVGGDGIVHMAVNACVNTDVPVGVIPAGTGNDSARALGIPHKDPLEAVRLLLANLKNPRRIDTIRATSSNGEFYCFGTLAAGFDSLVAGRANGMKFPKGPSRYQIAMVLELMKFKGVKFKAEIDGVKRDIEAMLCTAANTHVYGGGMLITPDAKLDDGLLDLFIVHKLPRLQLLILFPKVFTGSHVTHPKVEIVRGKSFKLDSGPMPVYAEGEAVGIGPVTAKVAPGSLLVFAP